MSRPRTQGILAAIGAVSLLLAMIGLAALALAIHGGFSTRSEPSLLEGVLAGASRRLAIPARARALESPSMTEEQSQQARLHWASHCASCHAVDGSGETEVGRNLYPRAPDLRAASTQRMSDGELYFVIKNGVRLTGMPAWGEPGDDDIESWALVSFIRTLPRLTEGDLGELRANLPRTPHELQEEVEEQQFLRGAQPPSP